jgi:cell division protein FtsB
VSYGAMLITFGGSFFVFMNELPKQDKLRDDIVNLKLSNAVLTTEVNYLKTEVKEFRVKTEFSK